MGGSDAKMAELILYVSDRCQLDPAYGATKLNKILFYADFLYYAKHGESITGQEYMRLDKGPAPRRLVPVREEMVAAGELVVRPQAYGPWQQKRPIALRDADLGAFSGEEIAMIDSVIAAFWGKSATEVSAISHRFEGWEYAKDRETIPYATALTSEREPDEQDYAFARELGREYAAARG
jgi:hypothetical protein